MYDTKPFKIKVEMPNNKIGFWQITAVNKYMAINKAYTKHDLKFFGTELAQRDRNKFTLVKRKKSK